MGQTKATYKNGEIGEKVHGLVLESNFFFLCHFQVGVLFFFFFFSLCQGVTRVDYICKDILGVKGGRCPPSPPSGSAPAKYQIRIVHKPKKEPQIKSKSCNAPRESKSPNRKTKTKQHKPLSLFQIATHKCQITKTSESLFFSHPLISFLSNFP